MASKREEERNEKIIRGLMKLPPNRRCINCNSLGPQYVCTNFWTFICTICSGIHREFTHRVKSVSMSKFTSQEVEALQNGGNQRAREIYLKDWDLQRQRLPNSSNVDKVRDFIKAVYLDRKYAGANKSEKDTQSEKTAADDARRASSYHSYSQSPPYDFQYEDRLNRKQGGPLSRKPGSDRGLFERKAASFVYSPGRFVDHHFEDRFANDGSSSQISDYSVSSGGDPFRSAPQSPNLQKDDGFSSPSSDHSREVDGLQRQTSNPCSVAVFKHDAERPAPRLQNSVSLGSFGSFDKVNGSLQSVGSGNALDVCIEPNQLVADNKIKGFAFSPPTTTQNSGQFNHLKDSFGVPASGQASVVDLFAAPATGSAVSIDLFQSPNSSVLSQNGSLSSSSDYLPAISQNHSMPNSHQNMVESSGATDEGWATFDSPQPSKSGTTTQITRVNGALSEVAITPNSFDSVSSLNADLQWPHLNSIADAGPAPLVSNSWDKGLHTNVTTSASSSEQWKAFEETIDQQHQCLEIQDIDSQFSVGHTPSTFDLFQDSNAVKDSTTDGFHKFASNEGFSFPTLPSHVSSGSTFDQPIHPFMADTPTIGHRSINPFDVSFDSEFEANNTFLNMNSLQPALPSTTPALPFGGGMNESWFPLNHMDSQGAISFITAQAPSTQLANVASHEPVASVGGNPFA